VHPGNIYAAAEPETGESSGSGKPVDDLWELEEQARRLLLVNEEEVAEKPTRKGKEKATWKSSKQRGKAQEKKKAKGKGKAKA
jgi:hypothetical protein